MKLGSALIEHGNQAQLRAAALADGIASPTLRGVASAPMAYAPEFADLSHVRGALNTGRSLGNWVKALRSLSPPAQPPVTALISATEDLRSVTDGVRRLEAGERSGDNLISDPVRYSVVMMQALARSQEALRGTTGEGIITDAHLVRLREYLGPHVQDCFVKALAAVDRDDALTRLLRKHSSSDFKPGDSLSMRVFLSQAAEAYEAARAAPPEPPLARLTELRSRLMKAFDTSSGSKAYDSLSPEVQSALLRCTNDLDHLDAMAKAFPEELKSAIKAASQRVEFHGTSVRVALK